MTTDREGKLPAYGRAGIPEVWIVNLESSDWSRKGPSIT